MTALFFFIVTAATLAVLAWSGFELFRGREDPLGARLEELQAHAISTAARRQVRRRGGLLTADEIGQKFFAYAVIRNVANPRF